MPIYSNCQQISTPKPKSCYSRGQNMVLPDAQTSFTKYCHKIQRNLPKLQWLLPKLHNFPNDFPLVAEPVHSFNPFLVV